MRAAKLRQLRLLQERNDAMEKQNSAADVNGVPPPLRRAHPRERARRSEHRPLRTHASPARARSSHLHLRAPTCGSPPGVGYCHAGRTPGSAHGGVSIEGPRTMRTLVVCAARSPRSALCAACQCR